MLKLIHSADLHLGDPAGVFAASARKQRGLINDSPLKLAQAAIDDDVQLVVLVGDVFDSTAPDEQLVGRFLSMAEKLAARQIYLVVCPGNHDRLERGSVWDKIKLSEQLNKYVKIARPVGWAAAQTMAQNVSETVSQFASQSEEQSADQPTAPPAVQAEDLVHIYLPELETNIFTRVVMSQKSGMDMTTGMGDFIKQVLEAQQASGQKVAHNLAMLHGSLQREGQKANFPISKEGLAAILEAGVGYVALGDWHGYLDAGKQLGLPEGRIVYSGSPELLDTAQVNAGSYVLAELAGQAAVSVKFTRQKLTNLEIVKLAINLNQMTWQTALKQIEAQAEQNGTKKILRIELTGEVSLADLVDIEQNLSPEALSEAWGERFYVLAVIHKVNTAVNDADLAGHPEGSIPHEFIKSVSSMVTSSQLDEELAQKVLATGMAAILDKLRKN